jgi:hypothetical protein
VKHAKNIFLADKDMHLLAGNVLEFVDFMKNQNQTRRIKL